MKKKKEDNKKIKKLSELERLETKSQEYLDGWKRALADYENIKKDISSQKEAERLRLKIALAQDLLPIIDNFDQALSHIPEIEDTKFQNWLDGVKYIKNQFDGAMSGLGIERIENKEIFDPLLHEAVSEEVNEAKKQGEIIKITQDGWKMGGSVIRPAKVIINKLESE